MTNRYKFVFRHKGVLITTVVTENFLLALYEYLEEQLGLSNGAFEPSDWEFVALEDV